MTDQYVIKYENNKWVATENGKDVARDDAIYPVLVQLGWAIQNGEKEYYEEVSDQSEHRNTR